MEVKLTFPHDGKNGDPQTIIYDIQPEALEAVRLGFNPSGQMDVTVMKVVAALALHLCSKEHGHPAGREYAVAKTNFETAAMWAVKAVTKGL
jgi:hypothetical protein